MQTITRNRIPLILAALLGSSLLVGVSFAQQQDHTAHHPAGAAAAEASPVTAPAAR